MQTFYEGYLNLLQACHNEIRAALKGLPLAALDWVPGAEMNSISVLVFHLTGSERYWIGDVAMQETSDRDRDAEFKVSELSAEFLEKRLTDSMGFASSRLETLTLQDLEAQRVSARNGKTFTVAWSLMHALEHSTLHLGQIQLTRQLWEQANKK